MSVLPDIRRPATRRVNAPPLPAATDTKLLLSTATAYLCRASTDGTTMAASEPPQGQGSDMAPHFPASCQDLLDLQHGVIARWQAAEAGLDTQAIDAKLRQGRWQPFYRGVYATFTGKPTRISVLWAAVLRGGPGAILSHHSAAELDGLADRPGPACHVMISSARRLTAFQSGRIEQTPRIVVHYSARIGNACHPTRLPPRTRIEETTVDLSQAAASLDDALSWLIRACSRRLTTAELLLSTMETRSRLRWRTELTDAVGDVGNGAHSILEWRYIRDVEQAHGLPRATRQAKSDAGRRTRYLDNRYPEFAVAVELDGQAAHPAEARWRDIHRDNASASVGIVTLRYGWADVTENPCRVAAEVAQVLQLHGWTGRLRACGPHCVAGP